MKLAEPVRVVARVTTRADSLETVKRVLVDLVTTTRMEPGCLSYELLQDASAPCNFTTLEQWASDADVDAHLASAPVQDALRQVNGMLASAPDIKRYRLVV